MKKFKKGLLAVLAVTLLGAPILSSCGETTQEEMTEEDIRKQLSSFQQTKRTYNIDGVILSKNKVDRNLRNVVQEPISTRDKIYLSLVDNTILHKQYLH